MATPVRGGARGGQRVRLVDVAAAAGVSKSVASRALADAPDIAEATKSRVSRVAQELGYQASQRARWLGRRNGRRDGLRPAMQHAALVSLQVPPEVLGASFLGPVLAGILSGAAEEGLELQHVLARPEDGAPAAVLGRLVAQDRADGLILLTFLPLTPADVAPLEAAGVPYVLVNRHFGPAAGPPVNCVTFEWEAATRDAVERLAGAGHRHLACLLPDLDNSSVSDRAAGWRAGVRGLRLAPRVAPILRYPGAPGVPADMEAGGRALAERLLRDGLPEGGPGRPVPTAIVGFNDWCALGVLRAARVRVPEQLSVIGFDSTRVGYGTTPPLCSYRPRFIEMGRRAAGLLAAALRGQPEGPRRIEVPVEFDCRGSSGPAPAVGAGPPSQRTGV